MVAAPMPTHSLRVSLAIACSSWRGAGPLLRMPRLEVYSTVSGIGLAACDRTHMILAIADVLSAADVEAVRAGLATATFVDGKATAGWSAKLVKSNLQASARRRSSSALRALVETRLARARRVRAGDPAQDHHRPAVLALPAGPRLRHARRRRADRAASRTDVSFTLFLARPETLRRRRAGHRHAPRARRPSSCRPAASSPIRPRRCIAWRRSRAASGWRRWAGCAATCAMPAQRELLFDLETARRRLFDREGKTAEGDLLAKCAANLMRLWCDD